MNPFPFSPREEADDIARNRENQEILNQTDKTFVLCIDPGTGLPFMINMGLKRADTIDLDNRSKAQRDKGISELDYSPRLDGDYSI